MSLPVFFLRQITSLDTGLVLDEDTSRHIVQVLRMKTGEKLHLTDGKGHLITAEITDDHKKHCSVRSIQSHFVNPPPQKISIAISLLKNNSRFEWFAEKATEIGVTEIIPLVCERTEKQKFRKDRMEGILISAMLQSQQCWLPVLHDAAPFSTIIHQATQQQKYLAHCLEAEKKNLKEFRNESIASAIILIGPEGDFTKDEIDLALQNDFKAVTLGETRLRTETAGLVAGILLKSFS